MFSVSQDSANRARPRISRASQTRIWHVKTKIEHGALMDREGELLAASL